MVDPALQRLRLVSAMKQARLTTFNRSTGRAIFEAVQECHCVWRKYECDNRHRKAQTFSCGFPVCPVCVPSRLRADFLRHPERLPDRLSLLVVKVDGATRQEISRWFKRWRREKRLVAGFYGIRLTIGSPDILLVLEAGEMPATLVADPAVTLLAADVSLNDAVAWYCDRFLDEVTSWRTPEELLDLLASVKGRRRFQGFGKSYGQQKSDDREQLLTGEELQEPKKVYKASGGSAKGASKAVICNVCGARMRFIGIALTEQEIKDWIGGQRAPPGREAAGVR